MELVWATAMLTNIYTGLRVFYTLTQSTSCVGSELNA